MTKSRFLIPMISAAALLPLAAHAQGTFFVPGTAGYNSDAPSGGGFTAPIAAGFYAGGTVLNITASGIQDSNTSNHFFTDANGALTSPTNLFPYANVGATNYPIVNGQGDGINHYAGGGTNYNTGAKLFAYAGIASTDTTDPSTIRFGALVGTFSATPVNNVDWFFIGTQNSILVPQDGATLYLADNDDPAKNGNNGGGFNVNVAPAAVPESSSVVSFGLLMAFGLGGLVVAARRKKARA